MNTIYKQKRTKGRKLKEEKINNDRKEKSKREGNKYEKNIAITHSKGVQQKGKKNISRYSLYIVHMPFLCNLCR